MAPPILVRLLRAWESIQVELQGQYSLERLREIVAHSQTSRRWKNYGTLVLTPIPGLLYLLLLDSLPLSPPLAGFSQQSAGIFVRIWAMILLRMLVVIPQIRVSSPTLRISTRQALVLCTISPLTAVVTFVALGKLWAFPTPCFAVIQQIPGIFVTFTVLHIFWREILNRDPLAKAKLHFYLKVVRIQTSVLATYIAYCVVFSLAGETYQPAVALILPVIKLVFKNKTRQGLYFMEDLAPSITVANIDVFHSVFISVTTQQAQGTGSIGVVMFIDLVQSIIAYVDVCIVVRRIHKAAEESRELDKYATKSAVHRDLTSRTASRLASFLMPRLGVIDYALYIIASYPRIREHPSVALPRHLRDQLDPQRHDRTKEKLFFSSVQVVPTGDAEPRQGGAAPSHAEVLTAVEQSHLVCVENVLKLLHMIEFYVLIEFAEVAIASVYTLYVLAISMLPNRTYYVQLKDISDDRLRETIRNLAAYSALELASLVLFCVIIDRQLQHLSSVQQLAFVLQKHRMIVAPMMAWYLVLVIQLNLEHMGMDLTFKFKWLHTRSPSI